MLLLGDVFPNFTAVTTHGTINFHEWLGDSWGILFSHPADFTPVCTTELAEVMLLAGEFKKRNCKLIALSCDPVDRHQEWAKDIAHFAKLQKCRKAAKACSVGSAPCSREQSTVTDSTPCSREQSTVVDSAPCSREQSTCGTECSFVQAEGVDYPIIADEKRDLATELGMLEPALKDRQGLPLTCRAVFIVGSDKKLKLQILYPASTGRNFTEVLRVLDSLQLTAKTMKLATPVDWNVGEPCIVLPHVKNEDLPADSVHTVALPSGKSYLRYIEKYDQV
jgi:alkyl hydroperoxide reductase subunit AhpC